MSIGEQAVSHLTQGVDQVKRGARLHKTPEIAPDEPLFKGILHLAKLNLLLETDEIVNDPLDIYFREPFPKVPILEEAAVSIAATKAIDTADKLNLFDNWATEVSKGKYVEKLAPTKGLARISGLSVITDRYERATKRIGKQTEYINDFIMLAEHQRPIVGRILRFL